MTKSPILKPEKQRLDLLMVAKNLAPTRSKARDLINQGYVYVDGEQVTKAGQSWAPTATITLSPSTPDYVSRSAAKLEHGLKTFSVDVKGRTALDVGASTGGFTQILLKAGAAHVYAVDVGHDQLHESLVKDERVTNLEGRDARSLRGQDFAPLPTILTCDASFISLIKVIEAPMKILPPGSWLIALIKPQFEVSKKDLNKKGVVRDQALSDEAIARIVKWFENQPKWHVIGTTPSPIAGHAGNRETLICVGKEDE